MFGRCALSISQAGYNTVLELVSAGALAIAVLSILAEVVGPKAELAIIGEADHGFGGREQELGELIVRWMEG